MSITHTEILLDRPRRLRFSINAFVDLEKALKRPLGAILTGTTAVSIEDFRAMLWAGLRWEDPDLTLEKAGEVLEAYLAVEGNRMKPLYELTVEVLMQHGFFRIEPKVPVTSPAGKVPDPEVSSG